MAWSTPLTAVANAALTASQWNLSVRDNMLETPAAKATTAGSYFASSGANTIAERLPVEVIVAANESTASTTFVALATAGPAVTVTSSTLVLITLTAGVVCDNATNSGRMSYAISGATTSASTDARALRVAAASASLAPVRASVTQLQAVTAGSNTYTAEYRTSGVSTSTFNERRVLLFPL